jgi:hypothetical protein
MHHKSKPTPTITASRCAWRAALFGLAVGMPALLHAVPSYTLDWNALAWTAGATTTTYTGIQGSNLNVTVTLSGSYFVAGFPDDTRNFTGGIANQDSLQITVDYPDRVQFTTVTLTFSQQVNSLTFSLFDIDLGTGGNNSAHEDLVYDFTSNGSATLSVTPGSTHSWNGSQLVGTAAAANNTADGNALINFSGSFTQVSFKFGTLAGSPPNPGQQSIALSNLTIVPIPEASQIVPLAVLFIGFAAFQGRRRLAEWLARVRA